MAEKVCSLVTSTPLIEPRRMCHQRYQALPLSSQPLPSWAYRPMNLMPMHSLKLATLIPSLLSDMSNCLQGVHLHYLIACESNKST